MALEGMGGGGRVTVTLVTGMGKAKLHVTPWLQLHFMSQGLFELPLSKVS